MLSSAFLQASYIMQETSSDKHLRGWYVHNSALQLFVHSTPFERWM